MPVSIRYEDVFRCPACNAPVGGVLPTTALLVTKNHGPLTLAFDWLEIGGTCGNKKCRKPLHIRLDRTL